MKQDSVGSRIKITAILSIALSLAALVHVYFVLPALIALAWVVRESRQGPKIRETRFAMTTGALVFIPALVIVLLAALKFATFQYEAVQTRNEVAALDAVRQLQKLLADYYSRHNCFPNSFEQLASDPTVQRARNAYDFDYSMSTTQRKRSTTIQPLCAFELVARPKASYSGVRALHMDETLVITIMETAAKDSAIVHTLPAPQNWMVSHSGEQK